MDFLDKRSEIEQKRIEQRQAADSLCQTTSLLRLAGLNRMQIYESLVECARTGADGWWMAVMSGCRCRPL